MTTPGSAGEIQDAVIGLLSDPATYGLHDGKVERIETHCSVVFLAGDRAYKLKRAIRYAALDYTTPALRQAACEAELRLNRRTAPELYLGVQAIVRAPSGALALTGAGEPVDHVVVMRRFPQADLFANMADAGSLTAALMRRLGTTVARFHQSAELTPQWGGGAALLHDVVSNDAELAKVAAELDGAVVATLSGRCRDRVRSLAPLLDRRRAEGKVRRCHGDLRLANICLYDGEPTLFDCIEFSDAVACIDVLHDLAFLLMDLLLRGRMDLANAVFNGYLDAAPETDGLRALPLFLALRAATRSYALAGSALRQDTPADADRQRRLARQHIAAGLGFLAPAPPRLLAVAGAQSLVRRRAAKLAAGVPPAPGARILPAGEAGREEAAATLRAGCSVVLAGGFTGAAERRALAALTRRVGLPCSCVGFDPPHETAA